MAVVVFIVGLVIGSDDLGLVIHQVGGRGHRLDRQQFCVAIVAGGRGAQVFGRRLRIDPLDHTVDRFGIGFDRFVVTGIGQVDDGIFGAVHRFMG